MTIWSAFQNAVTYNHSVIILGLHAPTNVETGKITSETIEVTWNRLALATGYIISYTNGKRERVDGGDKKNHTLNNLVENTPYNITVQGCVRCLGKSKQSAVVQKKTGKWCKKYYSVLNRQYSTVDILSGRSKGFVGYHGSSLFKSDKLFSYTHALFNDNC